MNLDFSAFCWHLEVDVDVDQEAFGNDSEYRLTVGVEDISADLVERTGLWPTALQCRSLGHLHELENRLIATCAFGSSVFRNRIFRFELSPLA